MKKWIMISIVPALAAVLISGTLLSAWSAQSKRMTKEDLQKILTAPGTYVLDVRTGRDWNSSEFKIQGAHRADPGQFSAWAAKYPKSGTLVLYCA